MRNVLTGGLLHLSSFSTVAVLVAYHAPSFLSVSSPICKRHTILTLCLLQNYQKKYLLTATNIPACTQAGMEKHTGRQAETQTKEHDKDT